MKLRILILLLFCSTGALAQRYGIGSKEGITGLKIFGGILLGVALITAFLYIRQRRSK